MLNFGGKACEIEKGAPDKFRIAAKVRRQNFHLLQLRRNVLVHVVVFGQVGPVVTGTIAHDAKLLRAVIPLVADENRGFAAANSGDTGVFYQRDLVIAAADDGVASDLTDRTIRIMRQDDNLL